MTGGRCHGPDCTQPALVEFFCGPGCQEAWERQAAGLPPVRWVIGRTSCMCGGSWAWSKVRESGAYEMVGCVCHNPPPPESAYVGKPEDLAAWKASQSPLSSAANQQVASKDPQVGFLGRAFHWLFGRTS